MKTKLISVMMIGKPVPFESFCQNSIKPQKTAFILPVNRKSHSKKSCEI
jgi:hypothetical protein